MTRTGRIIRRDPDIQSLRKHSPREEMVQTDFSEVERRVMAHMQAEETSRMSHLELYGGEFRNTKKGRMKK